MTLRAKWVEEISNDLSMRLTDMISISVSNMNVLFPVEHKLLSLESVCRSGDVQLLLELLPWLQRNTS